MAAQNLWNRAAANITAPSSELPISIDQNHLLLCYVFVVRCKVFVTVLN